MDDNEKPVSLRDRLEEERGFKYDTIEEPAPYRFPYHMLDDVQYMEQRMLEEKLG